MLKDYFMIGQISSAELGIVLQSPISFSAPEPKVSTISVPGRSGDLVFDDGGYNNITGKASCYVLDLADVSARMGKINGLLNKARGYQRLFVSNDPNHYRMARIANVTNFETRLNRLAPFEIEFDCKPQRFLIDCPPVSVNASPGTIYNPTDFDALPVLTISGSGSGSVTIGDKTITITRLVDGMSIDCESQNAYNGSENLNGAIQCDDFPTIAPGRNTVQFTGGVTAVKILPRWWEL